ncbi:MAG: hypothetical protein ACI9LM_004217 [Alteromonadaceae bacterium]|jgi:hypothetical protein
MIKKSVLIIILFLFVFGVPFSFLPINSSKVVLLALISWAIVLELFNKQGTSKLLFNKVLVYHSFIIFMLMSLAALYSILHSSYDFSVAYAYFIMLIEAFLGAYFLYVLFYKNLA